MLMRCSSMINCCHRRDILVMDVAIFVFMWWFFRSLLIGFCASDETVSGFFKAFSYVYSCFSQSWLFPCFRISEEVR